MKKMASTNPMPKTAANKSAGKVPNLGSMPKTSKSGGASNSYKGGSKKGM